MAYGTGMLGVMLVRVEFGLVNSSHGVTRFQPAPSLTVWPLVNAARASRRWQLIAEAQCE